MLIAADTFLILLIKRNKTRCAFLYFFSIAKHHCLKEKKVEDRSRQARATLSMLHLLTHSERHSGCWHQVRNADVSTRERRRPPQSHFNPCVSKIETDKGKSKITKQDNRWNWYGCSPTVCNSGMCIKAKYRLFMSMQSEAKKAGLMQLMRFKAREKQR